MRDHITAEDQSDSKVGRRALVRTGVWAVPVVAVVAAAPAFAVCSGVTDLHSSTGVGTKPTNKHYKADVTLKNTGAATTGLLLQVKGDGISSIAIAGWSKTSTNGQTTSWTPNAQLACNGSKAVTALIETGSNNSHTFTFTFTTTNVNSVPYIFSFTA